MQLQAAEVVVRSNGGGVSSVRDGGDMNGGCPGASAWLFQEKQKGQGVEQQRVYEESEIR